MCLPACTLPSGMHVACKRSCACIPHCAARWLPIQPNALPACLLVQSNALPALPAHLHACLPIPSQVQALDAAKGLLYLHSCNPPVLHRDVKSPNLLLDAGFRVKVQGGMQCSLALLVHGFCGNCFTGTI